MARDRYLEHLASVPLFASCTRRQLEELGRLADEVTVPEGQVLTRQGEPGADLFVIVRGMVLVARDGSPVATSGPGEFFGELAVLTEMPRNATVTTATEVELLVITRSGLSQLLDDVPGLAKRFLQVVLRRVVENAGPPETRPRRLPNEEGTPT